MLAFGLSTDYAVFLLGRVTEARAHGGTEREAVVTGLSRSGRIVTSATVLCCIPVAALALSRAVLIKELGLGTALAVFLDAMLIRTVLVPSLTALTGSWSWWAPGPLRRSHTAPGLGRLHRAEAASAQHVATRGGASGEVHNRERGARHRRRTMADTSPLRVSATAWEAGPERVRRAADAWTSGLGRTCGRPPGRGRPIGSGANAPPEPGSCPRGVTSPGPAPAPAITHASSSGARCSRRTNS